MTIGLNGCSSGDAPQGPPPDFSLAVSPSSLNLPTSTSGSVSVSVTGSSGFSSPVTIELTGLPPGVTVTPAGPQVKPGTPLYLTFTSAASVVPTTAFVTVVGSSGTNIHSTQFGLAIETQPGASPPAPKPPSP